MIDTSEVTSHIKEDYIYPGFRLYLEQRFDRLKVCKFNKERYLVEQIGGRDAMLGKKNNPDFIIAAGFKGLLKPLQVDFHAIEVKKTLKEAESDAVWQAIQYRNYAHFSYIACPVDVNEVAQKSTLLRKLKEHCHEYKLGLIVFRNSSIPDSYELLVKPIRNNSPDSERVYNSKAFTDEQFELIKSWEA